MTDRMTDTGSGPILPLLAVSKGQAKEIVDRTVDALSDDVIDRVDSDDTAEVINATLKSLISLGMMRP